MDNLLRVENIEFLLTNQCNMRCKYCFEGSHVKDKGSVDPEKVKQFLTQNGARNFYVFGGEPLLRLKELEEIINTVKQSNEISNNRKNSLLKGLRKITSNATLITEKNIEKIKQLELNFQISLDGYEEVNDVNRVFPSGKGSFKTVMNAIDILSVNNIEWSIHGVLNMQNSLHYLDIIKFLFNLMKQHKSLEKAVDYFSGNFSMFVFEDNYTDDFIDLFLDQLDQTSDWILNSAELSDLTKEQRIKLFNNVIIRKGVGGVCGVGRGLKTSDNNYNIHPCHRLVVRDDTILGNLFDDRELMNIPLYKNLQKMVQGRIMYSTHYSVTSNMSKKSDLRWWMYCPATNLETSGNPRFANAAYSVLVSELNRYTRFLESKYLGKSTKDN